MTREKVLDFFSPEEMRRSLNMQSVNFERVGNNPGSWIMTANGLLISGRNLRNIHQEAMDTIRDIGFDDVEQKAEVPLGFYVFSSIFLLYGFALENLFKALALKQGKKLVVGGRLKLDRHLQGHKLHEMASYTQFSVSALEREMLEEMCRVMNSVSRYPVANRVEEYQMRQHISGGYSFGPHLSSQWLDMADVIVLRLKEVITGSSPNSPA